ncbi:hypothetical protein IMSAGC019_02122 [Lachnospiraceae bacterium]|nr:hypothetical protein IMSAGC019_02122 [Lachnospiraceae bacterium]
MGIRYNAKKGTSLARRILHMVSLNNLKVDTVNEMPINPVIHSYYADIDIFYLDF